MNQYGADILRMWVASVDYTGDVRISMDMLKQVSESTVKFVTHYVSYTVTYQISKKQTA